MTALSIRGPLATLKTNRVPQTRSEPPSGLRRWANLPDIERRANFKRWNPCVIDPLILKLVNVLRISGANNWSAAKLLR